MTWDLAENALDYKVDPFTWLFPPVPLILLALEGVQQQQIMAILICLEWTRAMWWLQVVKLRIEKAPICLPEAAKCLRFPRGSTE